MLEWYRRDCDYRQLMVDCEHLFLHIKECLLRNRWFAPDRSALHGPFWDATLAPPWERLQVAEAFVRFSSLTVQDALAADRFDEILVEAIEPRLGFLTPTFLYDYPVEMASLARKKNEDPSIAERFELYLGGVELANGFSELTDVHEQTCRFEKEIDIINNVHGGRAAMPHRFLSDLRHLGAAAGIALGLDRIFMLISGAETINDAVSFSENDII